MVKTKIGLFQYLSLFLFLLMMVFPNMLNPIKALILFVMFMLSMSSKTPIHHGVKNFYTFYFIFGIYQILLGILLQNEKPFDWFTVTLLWPFFYMCFVPLYNSVSVWDRIIKVLILGHTIIVSYDLMFCFGIILGYDIPNIYASIMQEQTAFTFYEGLSSRLNFVNLNTITFTAPVIFVLWISNYFNGRMKIITTVLIIATFILFIISGRRSLMAIFVLCPFLILIFKNYFSNANIKALKKTLVVFLSILAVSLVYFSIFDPDLFAGYIETFTKAFDNDVEPIKFAQEKALLKAFYESPIFGHGAGARFFEASPGRGVWSSVFELQYHLVLARTGIIGFLIWGYAIFGLLLYSLKIVKKTKDIVLISLLYGYGFMLLANATNPVFCCFDFMLSYLLVTARLNYLIRRGTEQNKINFSYGKQPIPYNCIL